VTVQSLDDCIRRNGVRNRDSDRELVDLVEHDRQRRLARRSGTVSYEKQSMVSATIFIYCLSSGTVEVSKQRRASHWS